MKKYNSDKSRKLFDELILDCINLSAPYLKDSEQVKAAILYQVFFYSLLESGILYSRDNLFVSVSNFSFIDYPKSFAIDETENIQKLFIPELYRRISEFIIQNLLELPAYLLGSFFYENLLVRILIKSPVGLTYDKQFIKNNGVFYTPWETAETFIKGLFDNLKVENKEISEFRVLDLACGCGIFSIIILKILSEMVVVKIEQEEALNNVDDQNKSIKAHQLIRKNQSTIVKLGLLKNNLFAIDNDITALEISKYSLLLYSLYEEKNIISITQFTNMCATLKSNLQKVDVIDIYKSQINVDSGLTFKKFDIVVSNPPYISYYSRHSKSNDAFQKNLPMMKKNLSLSSGLYDDKKRSGRLNSIMFFFDYIMRLLSPEAFIGLLVDMSIHEDLYRDLRKWVLENITFLETQINISDFPGVNSGQTFIYMQNTLPAPVNHVKIIDHHIDATSIVAQSILKKYASFYVKHNSELLEQLDDLPVLGDCCLISTGVNIGGSSEKFLSSHDGGGSFYPMISPSILKNPYDVIGSRFESYIDFNKTKADLINIESRNMNINSILALGKLQRFLKPKIFVRQSAPRIIATYCEKAVVSPYSIFVINQKEGHSGYNLFVLLAILNSDLISYYCVKNGFIRQGSGKQPQIRKSGLRLIPVPDAESYRQLKDDIEKRVKEVYINLNVGVEKTFEDNDEIEKLVCLMYKVDYEVFKAEKQSFLHK